MLLADADAAEFSPGDDDGLAVHENLRDAAKDYDPGAQTDLRPGDRVAPRTRGALSRAWLPLPTVTAGTVRPRGS